MVSVHATLAEDMIHLVVSDTGVGLDRSPDECLLAGVGLSNVHKRITVLFGEEYAPTMESRDGGGPRVEMRIPQDSGHFTEQRSET